LVLIATEEAAQWWYCFVMPNQKPPALQESRPSARPVAPHVVRAVQAKVPAAPGIQAKPLPAAKPHAVAPHVAAAAAVRPDTLQAKPFSVGVVQTKTCAACHHDNKHGKNGCTRVLADGSVCGCKSHSQHWGKGSKKDFNPGGGKRGRMLDAKAGGAKSTA
jgi:hypothetical protein